MLTLLIGPMSLYFDGPDSPTGVSEFVNPQYTVNGYGSTPFGFMMTPEPSPTDATPRRGSFALSDNRSTSFCGSSAESSYISHSGCATPALSTPDSSASNSRRQSMLLPEIQQCYLSAISSSPSNLLQGPNGVVAIDQCHLQASSPRSCFPITDTASLINDGTTSCVPVDDLNVSDYVFTENDLRQWPSYALPSSLYGRKAQNAQIDGLTSPSHNPIAFNQLFNSRENTNFPLTPPHPDAQGHGMGRNPTPNTRSLEPPFELRKPVYDTEEETHAMMVRAETMRSLSYDNKMPAQSVNENFLCPSDDDQEDDHVTSLKPTSRDREKKPRTHIEYKKVPPAGKTHRCLEPECTFAFLRPEHLKRHRLSKHAEPEDGPEMLPCVFDGCKDPKTGKHREIQARPDNLRAHYTKTHFKYGNSEKGGKNQRKSMKAAWEMGLHFHDQRWALLLDKKMNVNRDFISTASSNRRNDATTEKAESKDFLHVWKMLGYSILETRDTVVKNVAPDWPKGSQDDTLQEYDPRWTALWDGTLTFDKAMMKGHDMEESDAQGLLEVTMLETEAMGIRDLDPRWKEMLNSRMSVEVSEKLGVKQRNPLWNNLARRRAR